jgi:chemotaxis protein histidine kinase CheA
LCRLADLRSDAELIGDPELVAQAASALAELDSGGSEVLAATVTAMAGTAAPMPEISEETQRLRHRRHRPDAELPRSTAEAGEVPTPSASTALLAANPGDREALRTIRRGFHTLKGSGRMVGLMDLGEVAYDVEKIHNRLLEEERPVTRAVQRMIEVAQRDFRQWVDALSATGKVIADPGELHGAIRAVEFELPGGRESVIKSVVPRPAAEVVAAAVVAAAVVAAALPAVESPFQPPMRPGVPESEPLSEPAFEFAPIDFEPGADLGAASDERPVSPVAVAGEPATEPPEFDLELPELGSGSAVIDYTSVVDFDEGARRAVDIAGAATDRGGALDRLLDNVVRHRSGYRNHRHGRSTSRNRRSNRERSFEPEAIEFTATNPRRSKPQRSNPKRSNPKRSNPVMEPVASNPQRSNPAVEPEAVNLVVT